MAQRISMEDFYSTDYKKQGYKEGVLKQDYQERNRLYLKGTPVLYKRTKDYETTDSWYPQYKWTGQFRTHYVCNDSEGQRGSFTVFYLGLLIE